MPYKNKQDKVANGHEYYQANKERIKLRENTKYAKNNTEIRAHRKLIYQQNIERARKAQRDYYKNLREGAIGEYGGKCNCCGEKEPLFLEIDHINGGGYKHRLEIGRSAQQFYQWLKKNNYPKDNYQILCANCNQGKRRNNGVCPHKKQS